MKTISPPGSLMTEVAQGLLASAQALGRPADVVATTSGAEFGYGFTVPDDVFDHWFLGRSGAKAPVVVPDVPEFAVSGPDRVPEPTEPQVPKKKGRGVKPSATDETGA